VTPYASPPAVLRRLEALYRALLVRHRGATDEQVHAIVQAGLGLALSTAWRRLPAGVVSRAIEPEQRLDIVVAAMAGRPASRAADAFLRLARARAWDG
jgi:LysR family hydrogen peroxide-inducible transcriptional activator